MKINQLDRAVNFDDELGLSDLEIEAIDYSGIVVASMAAFAIAIIGIITTDFGAIIFLLNESKV